MVVGRKGRWGAEKKGQRDKVLVNMASGAHLQLVLLSQGSGEEGMRQGVLSASPCARVRGRSSAWGLCWVGLVAPQGLKGERPGILRREFGAEDGNLGVLRKWESLPALE